MTPQQEAILKELYDWMKTRQRQALPFPLDDASKASLAAPVFRAAGSTGLTQVYTDSMGETHTGPKAYAGTVSLEIEGTTYKFPYIT